MEANKILDRQIIIEVVCAFIILGVILIGGFVIYNNIKGGTAYALENIIVDLNDDRTPSNLHIMSDGTGMKTNPYTYTITNNNKKEISYNIKLRHELNSIKNISDYIRVCIDDITIKNLSDFEVDSKGHYILLNEELESGVTSVHTFKVWLSNKSPNTLSGTPANINFSVESE